MAIYLRAFIGRLHVHDPIGADHHSDGYQGGRRGWVGGWRFVVVAMLVVMVGLGLCLCLCLCLLLCLCSWLWL